MTTLQISASNAADSSAANLRPASLVLRTLSAVVMALAEADLRRAERKIAQLSRTYRIDTATKAEPSAFQFFI